jgi:hypothetical protein
VRFRVVIISSFSEREQTRRRKFIELDKQVMFDIFAGKKNIKHYFHYRTTAHLINFEH